MQPVTPYIWKYQPETGYTAGAHQDYGSVINWLQSNPQMFERIREVNLQRNNIDKSQSLLTRGDIHCNINNWSASQVHQRLGTPYIPAKHAMESTRQDFIDSARGIQLSGPNPMDITGSGSNKLSSYPMITENISPLMLYHRPGQQLQGSGTNNNQNFHLLEEVSRQPRAGGLTPAEFLTEFPPIVYNHPFSKPLLFFPKEFDPLFSPQNDPRITTKQTLQYVS
ncbi:pVIII [Bovine adenovirus 6]|uniref:Pre-hexon-linking protein VIII n=1 Tax=Bovine adenovirus 6 TaxID=111167 RepID=K9MPD2_9ADEN|nr:pVIII [Bovine adenovirus 6]AFV70648.1 pVIII [Bovine adenovirus 6]